MAPAPSSPATVPLDVTLTANMGQDLYSMPVEIVEQVIINCDLASLDALFRTCGKFYSRFKKRESMILKLILKRTSRLLYPHIPTIVCPGGESAPAGSKWYCKRRMTSLLKM